MRAMSRRVVFAAALTVVVVVAAVAIRATSDAGNREHGASAPATTIAARATSTSAAPTTAPATTRGVRGNGNAVTFAFAGDVNFPEMWDTEDGPPPSAAPLAERVRADPEHPRCSPTPTSRW
jgi:hypothetical protein